MKGDRHSVSGADEVSIGLMSAGSGPALLLVHGGMGRIERWEPIWEMLTARWRVTAMDRRGRGSSGDSKPYSITKEYEDIAAVATLLTEDQGSPVDVFAHSHGATCTLGAAALGAPFRRVALYEPAGPETVPSDWVERATGFVATGQAGRAMFSFLTEVIGLTVEQVELLKSSAGAGDVLPIVSATLPREAHALSGVDLGSIAATVTRPVLLLLGAASPEWAGHITRALVATLPHSVLVVLPGQGHEAIDAAPELVAGELQRFFENESLVART